jgi:hypothetical protein
VFSGFQIFEIEKSISKLCQTNPKLPAGQPIYL